MKRINHYISTADKRKLRVRKNLHGVAARPRLNVTRSNKFCYMQLIDDDKGVTLLSSNDVELQKTKKKELTKTASTILAAQDLVIQMKKAKIKSVVFDRGQYKYHGRVKAIAEVLRDAGIKV